VECPPVAVVVGSASLITSSALLYNSIATQYNNGTLNVTTTNVIDGIIYVGSSINPIFSAVSNWIYTIPSYMNEERK